MADQVRTPNTCRLELSFPRVFQPPESHCFLVWSFLPLYARIPSASEAHTIVICNAILNSEVMTDEQTDAMVDRLAKHVKKELSET